MKVVFGSVVEMIAELKERGITEARLVAVQMEHHVKYGSGKSQFSVPHLSFESIVTAEVEGKLAECRIRHATVDAYMKPKVEEARQQAIQEEQRVRAILQEAGLVVRSGLLMEDTGVFFGSIEK